MSQGGTLRVTPVELAGVAVHIRRLARDMLDRSAWLRSAIADVGAPDSAADQMLLAAARATHAAFDDVSELLRSLLRELGEALDIQAAALAAAAHGYAYVEHDVGAAIHAAEPRHE
jgi:siderophore synthetase component